MNDSSRRTDRELFDAVATGESRALQELAARHARGLFDFALRGTLDEQQSAAVVEAAMRRVRQPGAQIPSQIDFRTWLYSLGLIDVLAVSNEARTARISTDDERFFQRTTDVDAELAQWAWQAARGLRTRDYCVLDLTLRRGLTPEEVAEAASLTRSNLYGSIGRARGAFEETFAAIVLFERGRVACPVLEEMVESSPGNNLRPALRHQIIEHADDCDACRRTLDSLPPAANVFVSLADIPIPETLVQRILGESGSARLDGPPAGINEVRQTAIFTGAAGLGAAGSARQYAGADTETAREEASDAPGEPAAPGAASVPTRTGRGAAVAAASGRAAAPLAARSRPMTVSREEAESGRLAAVFSLRQPIRWTYVLLGVAAVLAIYLGVAVADSLQSGGSDSGAVPLDSASGVTSGRVIDCGDAPLEMDNGASTVVSFDETALDGYQIRTISYVPVSETAEFDDLEGTLENPFLIRLAAVRQDESPPRTEEFELHIEWQRDDETAVSVCQLLVHVGT